MVWIFTKNWIFLSIFHIIRHTVWFLIHQIKQYMINKCDKIRFRYNHFYSIICLWKAICCVSLNLNVIDDMNNQHSNAYMIIHTWFNTTHPSSHSIKSMFLNYDFYIKMISNLLTENTPIGLDMYKKLNFSLNISYHKTHSMISNTPNQAIHDQ